MNRYTKIRDFHGERKKGVGSSDIPILAGMSKRYGSTSLSLWEYKTGRSQPWAGNNRTEWGNRLEGLVLAKFIENRFSKEDADKYLINKRRGNSHEKFLTELEFRHSEKKYCLAHPDLVVKEKEPYIVEAKTSGLMSGKRREGIVFSGYDPDDLTGQGIPDAVYLQIQWQMYCADIKMAYVAVLIDTADYREYGPIDADARVQERCLALAERFWRLVESDTAPAPETWDDVQRLFPEQATTTATISGDDEARVREMIARDKALLAKSKEVDDDRDDIKNAIGVLLGGNSFLSSADGDILAKYSESTRETATILARAKEITKEQCKKAPPPMTDEDLEILELAEKIRKLGLVSVSTSRRAVY